MGQLGEIYHAFRRNIYLLRKLLASFSKTTVIYTKWHPIYTSVFEDEKFEKYNPVYLNLRSKLTAIEKALFKKAAIIHADAANFPDRPTGKKIVVECEGNPHESYFSNTEVKEILVESLSGFRLFQGNERLKLCYPAIKPRTVQQRNTNDYITLLSVGHGGYIKGYDVLYRIYKELSTQYKVRLIIAGSLGHNFEHYPEVKPESYQRENFDSLHKDLLSDPNVILQPFRREQLISEVYPLADIYVQFSRMETFGYAILEAMSFGLPIVSCHFRAIKEMVQHGRNGYLVRSNGLDENTNNYTVDINDESWGRNCYGEGLRYIATLIEDKEERLQMGEASTNIINETFNINHKKQFLEKLYNQFV